MSNETNPIRTVLVLGAGGSGCLAQVGVLRALRRLRIAVDEVVGTGLGAVVGALFARSGDLERVADVVTELERHGWLRVPRLQDLVTGGDGRGRDYLGFLREHLPGAIGDVAMPFVCSALSLRTGATRYFGLPGGPEVPLADAVYASSCQPGLFAPLEIDGDPCVDAGLVEPLALRVARTRRAGLVVCVDSSAIESPGPTPRSDRAVLGRCYQVVAHALTEHALHHYRGDGELVLIQPGLRGDEELARRISIGEQVAAEALAISPLTRYLCDPDMVKQVDRSTGAPRDFVGLDVDASACINCGICAATCTTGGFADVPIGSVVRKLHHYECRRDGACERVCPTGAIRLEGL